MNVIKHAVNGFAIKLQKAISPYLSPFIITGISSRIRIIPLYVEPKYEWLQ